MSKWKKISSPIDLLCVTMHCKWGRRVQINTELVNTWKVGSKIVPYHCYITILIYLKRMSEH